MVDALPLPDQPRPGHRLVLVVPAPPRRIAAVQFLGQLAQPLHGLGLQPAVGQFLNSIGEPVFEKASIVRRRLGLEEIAPLLLQRGIGSVFRAATRVRTLSVTPASIVEGVGMTALGGGTVQRTVSEVGR